jgi:hypothetical protein
MASNSSDTQPKSVSKPDKSGALWNDYKHDQLVQVRTAAEHAALLKARAAGRIATAQKELATVPAPKPADKPEQHGIDKFHVLERMLDEKAFYPAHDKRTESPEYAKVHHQMTAVDKRPCLVCGVTNDTLHDVSKNPFGAIQLETHHHIIEWALANAISADKFNKNIRPGLERRAKARAGAGLNQIYTEFDKDYGADMTSTRILQWVDHAADNLWVLCDVHHRHKFVGIHAITYPIWGPQDIVQDDLVANQIEVAKEQGTHPGKSAGKPKVGGSEPGNANAGGDG